MSRIVLLAVIVAALALAPANAAYWEEEHWAAISISPEGGWGATADHYTQSEAEKAALKSCRENSKLPDKCIVQAVSGTDTALAWHCEAEDGRFLGTITYGPAHKMKDHIPAMKKLASDEGYDFKNCSPMVFATGMKLMKL